MSQHDVDGAREALCVLLLFSVSVVSILRLAQSFVLIQTYNVLVCTLYPLEAFPVLLELAPKVFQSFESFFLLRLDRLLLCELPIVVDGAREGCQGRIELGL